MYLRAVLIGVVHVAVLFAQIATCQTSSKYSESGLGSTSAQVQVPRTTADDTQPPLTERERAMLQRIQQLEQRLSNSRVTDRTKICRYRRSGHPAGEVG